MEQENKQGFIVDVFSGVGLGLLLGVIVGMASSPVVATVVGAIASVLAVFLGLEGGDSKLAAFAKVQLNGVRIGSFALATVIGLVLGLYIRINNPLAEPPVVQMQRWYEVFPVEVAPLKPVPGMAYANNAEEALRNRTLARQLMIFERTGLTPKSLDYGQKQFAKSSSAENSSSKKASSGGSSNPGSVSTEVTLSKSSGTRLAILFGKDNELNVCVDLNPKEFTLDGVVKVDSWATAFATNGFVDVYKMVRNAEQTDKEKLLVVSHKLLCDMYRVAQGEGSE